MRLEWNDEKVEALGAVEYYGLFRDGFAWDGGLFFVLKHDEPIVYIEATADPLWPA